MQVLDAEFEELTALGNGDFDRDRNNIRKPRATDENGNLVGIAGISQDIGARKRVEQALRQSEDKFAKAFHASPDVVVISRQADGRIVEVNAAWQSVFGHARDEVLGRTSPELGLFADPSARQAAVSRLLREGRLRDVELDVRTKQGSIRHTLLCAEPIEMGGEPHLLSVLRDVTDERRAHAALRESEVKFAAAFNACPAALLITAAADGRILDANEAWCRLVGFSREEIVGRTTLELDIWAAAPDRAQLLERLRRDGCLRGVELSAKTRSGETRALLTSVDPIALAGEECLLSLSLDLTESRRAEEQIRRLNLDLGRRVAERTSELAQLNDDLQREVEGRRPAVVGRAPAATARPATI